MPPRALVRKQLPPVVNCGAADGSSTTPCFMAAAPELGRLQHAKQAVWEMFIEQVNAACGFAASCDGRLHVFWHRLYMRTDCIDFAMVDICSSMIVLMCTGKTTCHDHACYEHHLKEARCKCMSDLTEQARGSLLSAGLERG